MNDFLCFEDDEYDEIFNAINNWQMIFHPIYAPEGFFAADIFVNLRGKENLIVFDRNIMTLLIEYVKNGKLKNGNETDMNNIALVMLWSALTDSSVTFGFAMEEYLRSKKDITVASAELDYGLTIYEHYPSMIWKNVLYSTNKEIPRITKEKQYNRKIAFRNDIRQLQNEASMYALVRIYKTTKNNKEKLKEFLNWSYDNTWISKNTIMYAILLFGNYARIKPPKNVNSKDIEKIINGCVNQSFDLAYLDICHHLYRQNNDRNIFFATFDNVLKILIIVVNATDRGENPIYDLFKEDADEIQNLIIQRQANREKPNINIKTLKTLIKKEKELLRKIV